MSRVRWTLGLTLLVVACQEPSGSVAPDARSGVPAFNRKAVHSEGILLGAPLFGLDAAPNGGLLAAVASAGVIGIRGGTTSLLADLPGASDVAAVGAGNAFVVTGGSTDPTLLFPTSRKLFRVSRGTVREVADLWAYEQAVNPDQVWNKGPVPVESNPFGVTALTGGRVLVADAAANDILVVDAHGRIDWVAVLTPLVFPPAMPETEPQIVQPVPTSVAVGPHGAYYVGELTGFPGFDEHTKLLRTGLSRIWRIAAGSRHVLCPSDACTLVAKGFTSIMDLAFGPDGTLYVVEFDEAGWAAVEGSFNPTAAGGTVNACNVGTGVCSVLARGLSLPTAITVDKRGTVWVSEHVRVAEGVPTLFGAARVRALAR